MTKAEIAAYCCQKLGITDASTQTLAGDFAKTRWSMIWNNALWRQSRLTHVMQTVPGEDIITLPATFEFVTAVHYDRKALSSERPETSMLANPTNYGEAGPVLAFSPLPKDINNTAKIQLLQKPTEAKAITIFGKAKCPQLVHGIDSPLIPGADECLCAFVLMDLCHWARQYDVAERYKSEANALLSVMKSIEVEQVAEIARFIPMHHGIQETW